MFENTFGPMDVRRCNRLWTYCDDVVEHASMFRECTDIEEYPALKEKAESLVRAEAEFREELERATKGEE